MAEEHFHIRHQERAQQQNDRKRDGRVKHDPERARVRRLERAAHRRNDLRPDAWDLGEIAGGDGGEEGSHRRLRKAGACGSRHDVLGQVLVQLVRQDRAVQGRRDGAAEAAYGAQDSCCETNVLCLPDERDAGKGDILDEADG